MTERAAMVVGPVGVEGLKVKETQKRLDEKVGRKSRIYLKIEDEGVMENFVSRLDPVVRKRSRLEPKDVKKHIMPQVLQALGLPAKTKVSFSVYAGCSMCPCSPGYIVDSHYGHDMWATVGV